MLKRSPKRYAGERTLDADETRRRSLAVRQASTAYPTAAEAMAFLNDHHPGLGGRPIDIATASEVGLDTVMATLKT